MRANLGPRVLMSIAPDGSRETIDILITPREDLIVDLGDGVTFREAAGLISIRSSWFTREFEVSAVDDIQLVFRMIRLADIYVQKICRDNGYELYNCRRGDVQEPFDTMR